MAQQVQANLSLTYSVAAQRFTPSATSPQFTAGVAANGGYSLSVNGGASVFSRVLEPLNADYDTGSGTGNEGFKFSSFPAMTDSAGNPIADFNGLPLDFTTLVLLAFHVRAIDPDQPWGGTVSITTTGDVVPGNSFGQTGIDSESLLACQRLTGWTPGGSGEVLVEFVPTTAPTAALVNAMVEMLVIGSPATPVPPAFTAPPTISGASPPTSGDTLTATTGTVTGTPTPLTGFQWARYNVGGTFLLDIPGGTGATYIVDPADVGYRLAVKEQATNSAGTAITPSALTSTVLP